MALAATTVPCAPAPSAIRVFPFTTTGWATLAANPCPAWLLLELSDSPSRTVMIVPAGITIGSAAAFLPSALPALPPGAPGPSEDVAVVLGFWQASRKL